MHSAPQKKKILVAVAQDVLELITGLFGPDHELCVATSLHHAQVILSQTSFDLIVGGARFDDSRLLDLLQHCKSDPQLAKIPFLCLWIKQGKLPRDTFRDLVLASGALGAAGFVDLEQWDRQYGPATTAVEFRKLVASLLQAS